jgi:phage terminase large subunit-like protein
MGNDAAAYLLSRWSFHARDEQYPPPGEWRVWLYLGGRGAGKTRAGAEWIAAGVRSGTMRRIALVGATHGDARAVMIEGFSGLLSVSTAATYEPSNRRVRWPGGAMATVLSAEEPDGLRGHQFDAAWADEFCKWSEPQQALDMLRLTLRIGEYPRLAVTTTPRNLKALKLLMEAPGTVRTHGTTRDNEPNLAPGFVADLEARYGGTRLGRQELDAEIIADVEGAQFKRDWIERARVQAAPDLARVVVAVDPPASKRGAQCGIVVAGLAASGKAYVLADRSEGGLTPQGWARAVARAYEGYEADAVVAEANQGGDMVRSVLTQEAPNLPVLLVSATRAKQVRAEPVAVLYEQGRVHHAGVFGELEDQMCAYDGKGESPDRMDALVWAIHELMLRPKSEPHVRKL